ncbi:MAG: O-antigen ligase family protein [Blastocatellia bacterium]|nr:O-antigen ligase family protein [Blastocatellia bacterium]
MSGDSSGLSRAIFIFVCAIPILTAVLYGGVDTGTWAVLTVLIGAMTILWLLEGWLSRGLLLGATSLLIPILALCGVGMLQLALGTSADPYSTRLFLIKLICYSIFFAAASTFINTPQRVKKIVIGIVIFAAAMALLGILQKLSHADAIYGMREANQSIPFGPFINQHHFAAFMEMAAALAVSLLVGKSLAREKKFLIAICLLVLTVAITLTGSRGGLISFIVAGALVGVVTFALRLRTRSGRNEKKARRLPWVIAGVAGLFLFVVFIVSIGGDESLIRGVGMGGVGEDVTNGRLHFWSIALKIFSEHPILGAGLESFGVSFTRHDTWAGIFRIEYAHNEYLQTLADSGIAGLACVVAFLVLLFRKSYRAILDPQDDFSLEASIGAIAGCFAVAIHSFVDFPLRTPSNAFFFLLLVVIATARIPVTNKAA